MFRKHCPRSKYLSPSNSYVHLFCKKKHQDLLSIMVDKEWAHRLKQMGDRFLSYV